MLLDAPYPSFVSEVCHSKFGRCEGSRAVVEGDNHTDVTESYDISASGIPDIRHKSNMLLDAPATSIIGKVLNGYLRILEGVITVVERD